MVWLLPLFSLASVVLVRATVVTVKRQAITTLSPPEIDAFAPFTHFASTAYCNPSATIEWTCGCAFAHCLTLEARLEEVLLKWCSHSQL